MAFDKHINEMRALAKQLVKYSFPNASPVDEEILSCLKQREIVLDGYNLIVYFNKCQHADTDLETLQVFGKYFSFLPFSLICKVAYKFLGNKELSLIEVVHNKKNVEGVDQGTRKIYVWTVYHDSDGNPITSPFADGENACSYEGLKYSHVDRNQIMFF